MNCKKTIKWFGSVIFGAGKHLLWMERNPANDLGCIKPCKQWDKLHWIIIQRKSLKITMDYRFAVFHASKRFGPVSWSLLKASSLDRSNWFHHLIPICCQDTKLQDEQIAVGCWISLVIPAGTRWPTMHRFYIAMFLAEKSRGDGKWFKERMTFGKPRQQHQ